MKLLIISQFWSFPEKIPALGKTGQEMGIGQLTNMPEMQIY